MNSIPFLTNQEFDVAQCPVDPVFKTVFTDKLCWSYRRQSPAGGEYRINCSCASDQLLRLSVASDNTSEQQAIQNVSNEHEIKTSSCKGENQAPQPSRWRGEARKD